MVGTIEQRELDIHHREASQNAALDGILQPLVDRRDVFARNDTTLDGIDELVAFAGLVRLDLEPDVTELTTTTGLLDELAFLLDRLLDAFAIGNLRRTDGCSTLNSRRMRSTMISRCNSPIPEMMV